MKKMRVGRNMTFQRKTHPRERYEIQRQFSKIATTVRNISEEWRKFSSQPTRLIDLGTEDWCSLRT